VRASKEGGRKIQRKEATRRHPTGGCNYNERVHLFGVTCELKESEKKKGQHLFNPVGQGEGEGQDLEGKGVNSSFKETEGTQKEEAMTHQ